MFHEDTPQKPIAEILREVKGAAIEFGENGESLTIYELEDGSYLLGTLPEGAVYEKKYETFEEAQYCLEEVASTCEDSSSVSYILKKLK